MSQSSKGWIQLNDIVLSNLDRDILISGGKLSDLRINYAQGFLKHQFPFLNGLKSKEQPKEEREGKANFISYILEVIIG